jgi:hypothetical protein
MGVFEQSQNLYVSYETVGAMAAFIIAHFGQLA